MEQLLLVIAAGGTLWDGWQIARPSGRVDALESTMQTVSTLLAGRAARGETPRCTAPEGRQRRAEAPA